MNPRLKLTTFAIALVATTLTAGGVAMAATPHHMRNHARLTEECSTLAGQWSTAETGHHRHLRAARAQERIGARDCRSNRAVELKAGVQHYRSALRMIGVRPSV
jgi:hypothetical protein